MRCRGVFLAFGLVLAGHAALSERAGAGEVEEAWLTDIEEPADPIEPVNRAVFAFNTALFDHVLEPAYKGYVWSVPDSVRLIVKNVFDNARLPFSAANAAVAGRFDLAGGYTKRFAVNTTLGALGALDVASEIGFEAADSFTVADVLCAYRLPGGPYLVLPFFGPSNARSVAGRVGDTVLGYSALDELYPAYFAGINLNRYARVREARGLLEASVDPYLAARSTFAQLDTQCGDPQ